MSGTVLALLAAFLIGGASLAVSVRARAALRGLKPPLGSELVARARELAGDEAAPAQVIIAELEAERRGALTTMALLLMRFRSAARVALASGTASALLALADGLARGWERALAAACVCFALGAVAASAAAQLGHSASGDRRRFRDEWNRRCREATQQLEPTSSALVGEWTPPRGAG